MEQSANTETQQVNAVCQSLVAQMQLLEDDRLRLRSRTRFYWLITLAALVAAGIFIYLRQKFDTPAWIAIGVFFFGIIILYFCYVYPLSNKFQQEFKEKVIRKLIEGFLPQSIYQPDSHISMSEYAFSSLFTKSYDRYSGANYVEGMVGKTAIIFSELHTEYKEVTRTKNGTRTTWHTIFQGMFMRADSNKNFGARTYILPDVGERYFGNLGKWFQRNVGDSRGEVVYMENVEFEKKFAVYTTDPVEARYLITPQMQERMLALYKHVGGEVYAAFVGNKLYIAINNGGGLFRLNTGLSLLSVDTLKYYAKNIIDMIAIVNILDLNTRIWGRD